MTTAPTLVLPQGFGGDVIAPGSPEYDDATRTLFATGSPRYVLRPRSTGDVQAAVRLAAASGLALSVRGGGHSFPGFGTNDDGIVIDLRHLDDVEVVDAELHVVRVGGGATWGQVADTLAEHGIGFSSGDTRSVGVGGLTLSGGIGWKVRKHGLALDNLVGAEVVTADGAVLHTSEDEHPNLFWALRGGGGNVGVVTAFELVAHPTTDVFHGHITFPAAETEQVLQGWAAYQHDASEDLTSMVVLANPMTGGPEAPVEVHVVVDTDHNALAAEILEPIHRLGTVLEDHVGLTPYADVLVDGPVPPPGLQFVSRNAFVGHESTPDALRILAESTRQPGSPVVAVRTLGGAVARVEADATAYAHRQAELMVASMTVGPPPVVAAALPGLDAFWARLAPHTDGAYANFLSGTREEDVAAVYPEETRRWLAAVKRRYDPDNLFAANHNVRPTTGA
ncbi:FAD-binding oxidoreductase [Aeromicrobium terrae]|uniref:FAD-dependent oxidoreductase n=1 Tax=Aeromicrobium terrae TaxID=2498846 RepID=A0A5C8NKM1_9ACTN|nr:FAD-dependent oxidoreductase [Aeromicrobium terrae]TXL61415.1 FAD-dependent oxidoreductase [Aeromicrobium terrae]